MKLKDVPIFRSTQIEFKMFGLILFEKLLFFVFRFSQFFISPLLRENAVEREIKAVDSGMIKIFCFRMRKKLKFSFFFSSQWFLFCVLWKQKEKSFLMFSMDIERDQWHEMG